MSSKIHNETASSRDSRFCEVARKLASWFGTDFEIVNVERRKRLHPQVASVEWSGEDERFLQTIVANNEPSLLCSEPKIRKIVIPLPKLLNQRLAAMGIIVETSWSDDNLRRMASLAHQKLCDDELVRNLEAESELLAEKLADSYDEIALIYEVIENLSNAPDPEYLVHLALDALVDVLPAEAVAVVLGKTENFTTDGFDTTENEAHLFCRGIRSINLEEVDLLLRHFGSKADRELVVHNLSKQQTDDCPVVDVRHLIMVPIVVHQQPIGWMLAVNHARNDWFGSIQAKLLHVVARIVGVRALMADTDQLRIEAESANTLKSNFLANMSHELRTPLNGIVGFAKMLLCRANEGNLCEFVDELETIDQSAERLLEMINDVLYVAHLESNARKAQCFPFVLHDVVTKIVSELTTKATAKGLELNVDSEFGPSFAIVSDPQMLESLLKGLARNAIKFTESGSIWIKAVRSDESGMFCIEVIDTGIGMSSDTLKTIFEPFVQGDGSTTRRHGGVGIGLALCKRLANSIKAELFVESEVGKGSKFTIQFDKDSVFDWANENSQHGSLQISAN